MSQSSIVHFVEYVLRELCEAKDEIRVEGAEDEKGYLVTVHVAEADMGRLIGKNGQTVSAIRLLVRSMGAKDGIRSTLKVMDE